jgi:cell division protein FtsZ
VEKNITIFDASDAVEYIRDSAGGDIDIIFGVAINEQIGDSIIVTVIATGFDLPKTNGLVQPVQSAAKVVEVIKNEKPALDDDGDIPGFFKSR